MFHAERMKKLSIIGPGTKLDVLIKTLHRLRVLHVVDHQKSDELDIGRPLERAASCAETLLLLRSINSCYNLGGKVNHANNNRLKSAPFDFKETKATVERIYNEMIDKTNRIKSVSERIAEINRAPYWR